MEKDQKTTLQIYLAYIIAVICNVIPSSTVQTFGLILFIVIFAATYFYRGKSPADSFIHNHMQFIIKSIWVSSLILLIGMIAAYFMADHTIVYQTYETIMNGIFLTQDQINGFVMDYMRANIFTFVVTLMPSLIYLAYRLAKGILHARKGYIVPHSKSWF